MPDERGNPTLEEVLASRYGAGSRQVLDVVRGVPMGIEGIASLVPALRPYVQGFGASVNKTLGTANATFADDPAAAVRQTVGGALLGLPARAVGAVASVLPNVPSKLMPVLKGAEAVSPLTLPLTNARIGANVAGGMIVGPALEGANAALETGAPNRRAGEWTSLGDFDDETLQPTPVQEAPSKPISSYLPTLISSANAASAQAQPADPQWTVNEQAPPVPTQWTTIDRSGAPDMTPAPHNVKSTEEVPKTWGERVRDYLPYALLGGGAAAAGASARQWMQRKAASDALDNTVVSPGTPPTPNAYLPTLPQAVGNAVFDEGTVARSVIDKAETLGAQQKPGGITPEQAAVLRTDVDLGTNKTAREGMVLETYRTGYLPSGHKIGPSAQEIAGNFRRIQNADPDKAARIENALRTADELDNRLRAIDMGKPTVVGINPATGMPNLVNVRRPDANGDWIDQFSPMPGRTGMSVVQQVQEPARVGMIDKSWDDLHNSLRADLQDPDVRQWVKDFQGRYDKWRTAIVREGLITQQEANRFASKNPYYIPTLDPTDASQRHLTRREIEENTAPLRGQSFVQSMLEYESEMVNLIVHNRAKQRVGRFLDDFQKSGALGNKQIVGDITKISDTDPQAPGTISFRENGVRLRQVHHVPEIANVMRNDPKLVIPIINGTRKAMQFFTTGPGSVLTGGLKSSFAPVSAALNLASTVVNRPAGTRAGLVDAGLQAATNGKLALRGDLTLAPVAVYRILADWSSLAARETANVMRGYPGLQQHADWLAQQYHESILHYMNRTGAVNTGGAYSGDYTSRLRSDIGSIDPAHDATRGLGDVNWKDYRQFEDNMARIGYTVLPWQMRKAWQIAKEGFDIVSNSPQSAVAMLNRSPMQEKFYAAGATRADADMALARTVRQVGADPSISGSSRFMQAGNTIIPYFGISIQGINTYLKSFAANPVNTAIGMTAVATQLAMLSAYTAMLFDEDKQSRGEEPEAVRDRILSSSTDKAGGIKFYIPGIGVTQALRLPIDPIQGPLVHVMGRFFDRLMGLDDPQWYGPSYENNREALRAVIEQADHRALMATLVRPVQFSPPPLMEAAAQLKGTTLRDLLSPAGNIRTGPGRHSRGFTEGKVPNDPINDTMSGVLEAMTGAGWGGLQQQIRTYAIVYRDTGSLDKAWNAAMTQRDMVGEDRQSFAPGLWAGPQRRHGFDVNAEIMVDAEKKLNELSTTLANAARPNTVGSSTAVRETPYGQGRPTVNPDILPIVQHFGQLRSELQELRNKREALKDDIRSLRGNSYDLEAPRTLRMKENDLNAQIRDINQEMVIRIVRREQHLSNIYKRDIKLETLDVEKGKEQFTPRGSVTPQ